ncbi:MAG: biotin/lipoyl-binding protein [Gammaproteobacteria bacterium]|nr:biotin/lipoyl-binding protein [Gammaproteobacteria bacterium]
MIGTLLVANRGEIACRVMHTARRLGIETVAVYSDADAHALHVRQADRAVRIGPPVAAESYLNIEAVMAAIAETGADAVHPGYGFLSENAEFAGACAAAGCIFVGPSAAAIRAMGSKIEAKHLVADAGTPVVPGYLGDDQDPDVLSAKAQEVGFPLLIKASAGGGGRGMRRVDDADSFGAALEGARREATAAFGDDRVLLERLILKPKHIEVQVLGDDHGNMVYLFERDCSMQRRHQKVVEEAPGPTVSAALRTTMGEAAVRAARAIDYVGAGTVEFITEDDDFYFMEMNTRLQVEHPVTEAILGLDLVELQLRVAAGEPIPFAQEDLEIDGHAIEVRVYAENPKRNFLPSSGKLHRVDWPNGVRVDAGVETGSDVPVHYDPMMAKVIAHAPDRPAAIAALRRALRQTEIVGVEHNVGYLANILAHAEFGRGTYTTALAEDAATSLAPPDSPVPLLLAVASLVVVPGDASPWAAADGFQLNLPHAQRLRLRRNRENLEVRVTQTGSSCRIEGLDEAHDVCGIALRGNRIEARIDGESARASIYPIGDAVFVVSDGTTERIEQRRLAVSDFRSIANPQGNVAAPMPGAITAVAVSEGDLVKAGQTLMVLEAMKMEHTIVAPGDGKVATINVSAGERVDEGTELLALEDQ